MLASKSYQWEKLKNYRIFTFKNNEIDKNRDLREKKFYKLANGHRKKIVKTVYLFKFIEIFVSSKARNFLQIKHMNH